MTLPFGAVVIAALIGAITNAVYVFRSHGPKRLFRALCALSLIGVSILYGLLAVNMIALETIGPTYIRSILVLVLLLLAAEPIADWGD